MIATKYTTEDLKKLPLRAIVALCAAAPASRANGSPAQ